MHHTELYFPRNTSNYILLKPLFTHDLHKIERKHRSSRIYSIKNKHSLHFGIRLGFHPPLPFHLLVQSGPQINLDSSTTMSKKNNIKNREIVAQSWGVIFRYCSSILYNHVPGFARLNLEA